MLVGTTWQSMTCHSSESWNPGWGGRAVILNEVKDPFSYVGRILRGRYAPPRMT